MRLSHCSSGLNLSLQSDWRWLLFTPFLEVICSQHKVSGTCLYSWINRVDESWAHAFISVLIHKPYHCWLSISCFIQGGSEVRLANKRCKCKAFVNPTQICHFNMWLKVSVKNTTSASSHDSYRAESIVSWHPNFETRKKKILRKCSKLKVLLCSLYADLDFC